MRIAVQGAGAMGLYLGGLLAHAGEDVTVVARGATLEALRTRGLIIKSKRFDELTIPVKTLNATAEPQPERAAAPIELVDLILFCVKTYDTQAAAEGIRALVGPNTVVLSVQNGVESAERIADVAGPAAVIGGVAQVSAVLEAPGVAVGRAEPAILRFGELTGGVSERTTRLASVFSRAGIVAEPQTDIRRAIWEKFIFICALSGVTALTRLPLGPLLSHEETRALLRGVLDEVAAVARARNIELPDDAAERMFDRLAGFGPDLRGSMAYDLNNGKRLEVDALNGAVVRLGRQFQVATPVNAVIAAALAPYRDGPPTLP